MVELPSDSGKVELSLDANDILYLTSEGNYVKVCFRSEQEVEHKLIRNTLKTMATKLDHIPFILRCHRAFLVNRNHISDAKGNAQGLSLSFDKLDESIPVSRRFVSDIRASL